MGDEAGSGGQGPDRLGVSSNHGDDHRRGRLHGRDYRELNRLYRAGLAAVAVTRGQGRTLVRAADGVCAGSVPVEEAECRAGRGRLNHDKGHEGKECQSAAGTQGLEH